MPSSHFPLHQNFLIYCTGLLSGSTKGHQLVKVCKKKEREREKVWQEIILVKVAGLFLKPQVFHPCAIVDCFSKQVNRPTALHFVSPPQTLCLLQMNSKKDSSQTNRISDHAYSTVVTHKELVNKIQAEIKLLSPNNHHNLTSFQQAFLLFVHVG